jgi:hypothetical protein
MSNNNLTKNDLLTMARNSESCILEIENTYNNNIKKLNEEYKGRDLELKLSEEKQTYYNKKKENERKTKLEIENIQKKLLDEIKLQYTTEQKKIMKEYNVFETNAKNVFKDKENVNLRNYTNDLDSIITKYNKKLNNKNYIQLKPITVENIIKTMKITSCDNLIKLDLEFNKNKKNFNNEYKKTKEKWNEEDEHLYESFKDLEMEYNSRCSRLRYKFYIEKFIHINKCKNCKTENFLYLTEEYLFKYFSQHKFIENDELIPSDKYKLVLEFIKKFIDIFTEYYNNEINRIHDYEVSVPKEQNLTYTVLYAEKIWTKIKSLKILDLKFNKKTDDEKIDQFRKQEEKFYKDFPIVARYMVCADVYNRVAFKKFLTKLLINNEKKQKRTNSKEGEAENEWIELQADYVKYLYQEQNKSKHLSTKELQNIWKETYELLKKEFSNFKEIYDKKVKQIEEDKKIQNGKIAKDVLNRLTTIQSVDNETQYKLYVEMQDTLFLQRTNKNLKLLLKETSKLDSILEGRGKSNDAIAEMERDKKMKDAKNKFSPESQIKNPVKYYYENLESTMDAHMFKELRNLRYLQDYRDVLYELYLYHKKISERINNLQYVEGYGSNKEESVKLEQEQQKWKKDHPNTPIKIHIPYTRNLLKMYYENEERFEI